MKLALVFNADREDTIGWHFVEAAAALGVEATQFQTRDAAAIRPGFDLYLRIDHGDYADADLPKRLRPRAFYAIDTHLPRSWAKIRRLADRYHLVMCAHRRGAEDLHGAWVPVAANLRIHGRQPLPARWDVASVATEGGVPRKFVLQALRERYPHHSIGEAPGAQVGAIYSQAKIGFNLSIRDDVNMRVFEVLAAGALLVTNRLPHEDLAQLGLREGEHYVAYGRPGELLSLIDHYLRHEPERQAIAQAGMRLAHARHTYTHRLHRMLTLAAERLRVPVLKRATSEVPTCTCS
jgi:hypothetical protein